MVRQHPLLVELTQGKWELGLFDKHQKISTRKEKKLVTSKNPQKSNLRSAKLRQQASVTLTSSRLPSTSKGSHTDLALPKKKDFDKKKVIGSVSNEQFSQLITLSKNITDYNAEDEDMVDPDLERREAEIDEEGGVAVVFDEEEQDDEDEEGFEIREEPDEEQGDDIVIDGETREEDLVIGGESARTVKTERILFHRILSMHSGFSAKSQKFTPTQLPLPTRLPQFSAFSAPNLALATAKIN